MLGNLAWTAKAKQAIESGARATVAGGDDRGLALVGYRGTRPLVAAAMAGKVR